MQAVLHSGLKVSLRFCLATSCTDSVRHGELLIRACGPVVSDVRCLQPGMVQRQDQVGVALSKQAEQDLKLTFGRACLHYCEEIRMFMALQDSGLIMQYYEKANPARSRMCIVSCDIFLACCEAEQILVKLQRQNSHWYAILAAARSLGSAAMLCFIVQ